MKLAPLIALAALIPSLSNARSATTCSADTLSKDQAVELQTQIFAALEHEDRPAWDHLVAPDFLAFERGKHYDSGAFFGLVVAAHKTGLKLTWSVTGPRVAADCQLAIMSYTNAGSVTDSGGQQKSKRWLETVTFRKDAPGWRAILVTSMVDEEETAKEP
jgi:ketosteroid isomerase-like protein